MQPKLFLQPSASRQFFRKHFFGLDTEGFISAETFFRLIFFSFFLFFHFSSPHFFFFLLRKIFLKSYIYFLFRRFSSVLSLKKRSSASHQFFRPALHLFYFSFSRLPHIKGLQFSREVTTRSFSGHSFQVPQGKRVTSEMMIGPASKLSLRLRNRRLNVTVQKGFDSVTFESGEIVIT